MFQPTCAQIEALARMERDRRSRIRGILLNKTVLVLFNPRVEFADLAWLVETVLLSIALSLVSYIERKLVKPDNIFTS